MNIEIPVEELRKRKLFIATPMFGGSCNGLYAKSCADLSSLCTQYGIALQYYYLFNESLVTRSRNYCCDEFMRSGADFLMFIDADIGFNPQDVIALMALQIKNENYDIIGGPYSKKCLPSSAKIETENGTKTISEVISEKYSGKIKCFDGKNISWSNVTNWWKEKNKNKKWVGLSTAKISSTSKIRPRAKIICTEDHDVAYISNPLTPVVQYKPANMMINEYLVQTPKTSDNPKDSSIRYPLLNKEQVSVMIGTALGDGCVTDGKLGVMHGAQQETYNRFIWNILGGRFYADDKSNHLDLINGQTQYLKDILYDGKQKTIRNVIDYIDDIALAIMYLDDGNRYYYPEVLNEEITDKTWWYNSEGETKRSSFSPGEKWKRGRRADAWRATASIATMSFTYDDHELLVDYLKSKFDLDSYILKQKNHYYIKFDKDNTDKLHKIIAKYVPECMEYKINPEYRGKEKHVFDVVPLQISATKVQGIYGVETNSHLYDIEVEDNHNFFINDGALVHNCISWEKVKVAVDKGLGDNNPNELEKYIGDFVFNPKSNQANIPIGEPCEVLEIGTGFMMITKNAMNKFYESYKEQYSYLPDHVRTEAFDGSREILMFFQAEIDPKSKRYLSEDYWFCQKAHDIGLKTWLCPWMKLQHVGTYIFGGSLADLAAAGVSATADPEQLKKTKKK